ncbi:MAG TPA: glycine zipper 2TM domain-containing protein [Caulobacteraceae bacterium]|nr:glycine zipper 2TM domain-containing protein [Polyangia bacterium]HWA64225.1 glycine zipper 2TM domain-containing protein [Caulobacteraceae bacterium]
MHQRLLTGLLTAASLAAAAAPGLAQAQSSSGYYEPPGGYHQCQDRKTGNTVAGAVVGGLLGAVVGSQVSGHGARTEGSVVGGGLGALAGAAVGDDSVKCGPPPQARYDAPPPPPPPADDRYQDDESSYPADGRYDHPAYEDSRDYRAYPARAGGGPGDCALADSTIYMPDGTTQKRFVRVCRDDGGRYQVVE